MNNNFKDTFKDKMKEAGWLLPGLEVKRWFALIFLGSSMLLFSLEILMYSIMLSSSNPNKSTFTLVLYNVSDKLKHKFL